LQINALCPVLSYRDGQIETIGRIVLAQDTDDLPGRGLNYGPGNGVNEPYQGDTTDNGYCTYPNVWLRVQRQGERLMSYFATANTSDAPAGWASNPDSTNGWQLLGIIHAGPNFPQTLYVGLSTVAHNSNPSDTTHTVSSTYANFGPSMAPRPLLAKVPDHSRTTRFSRPTLTPAFRPTVWVIRPTLCNPVRARPNPSFGIRVTVMAV
jgi:hypothetical protein